MASTTVTAAATLQPHCSARIARGLPRQLTLLPQVPQGAVTSVQRNVSRGKLVASRRAVTTAHRRPLMAVCAVSASNGSIDGDRFAETSSGFPTQAPPQPLSPSHVLLAVAAAAASALISAAKHICSKLASLCSPITAQERAMLQGFNLHRMQLSGTLAPLCFAAIGQATDSASNSTPLTVIASGMAKWLELYSGLLLIRVLLSWFPNIDWERQPLQAIRDMSDPYLNLFRNIMPPFFGALDLSPMLAFLVLGMLTSLLNTTVFS